MIFDSFFIERLNSYMAYHLSSLFWHRNRIVGEPNLSGFQVRLEAHMREVYLFLIITVHTACCH